MMSKELNDYERAIKIAKKIINLSKRDRTFLVHYIDQMSFENTQLKKIIGDKNE